jgi:hypothetical protein
MTDAQRFDELLSWHEIYRLLCDYMRGQDRLLPALHRSVFHDDATTDYGAFKGGPDAFVTFSQDILRSHHANHHMIGQVDIQFDGDVAFGEVYFQAFHRVADEGGAEHDFWVSGRYIDRYERRTANWKIAHRSELVDWLRSEPAGDAMLRRQAWPFGRRAPDDLSCDRAALRNR